VRFCICGPAVAAVAVLSVPTATAHTFAIQGDIKIGAYAVKADGSLAGVIRAFGRPETLRRSFSGKACRGVWPQHGLTVFFYNLGGTDACRRDGGRFSRAIARGDHWMTTKRLRIGDSVRRVRALYPRARFERGEPGFWPSGWWLLRRYSIYGEGRYYPGLLAEVRAGKIAAFHVSYAAGGD
jgi:hypothetical protein